MKNRALVFLPETDMYTDPFIRLKRGWKGLYFFSLDG